MSLLYLGYLLFALAGTFGLLHFYKIKLSSTHKRAICISLALTLLLFGTWDVLATLRGHWSFGTDALLGIWIGPLPLEEWLFFLVIPFFGLAVWEIQRSKEATRMMEYTLAVVLGFFIVLALDGVLRTHLIRPTKRFLQTSLIVLGFQVVFDNYFTRQGLWSFNPNEIIGLFVPTIPIENLVFGMEMLWFCLIVYEYVKRN